MAFIRDQFTVLRLITLDGFSGDPDWVADYDAVGARVAGNNTCIPTRTGQLDVVFGYLDADNGLIPPSPSSNLDFQVIALGSGRADESPVDAIYGLEVVNNTVVSEIATITNKLAGSTVIAIRVTGLTTTPVAAIKLFCALRVG